MALVLGETVSRSAINVTTAESIFSDRCINFTVISKWKEDVNNEVIPLTKMEKSNSERTLPRTQARKKITAVYVLYVNVLIVINALESTYILCKYGYIDR